MALALYRKYRPKTFAEVIGQEHVTEPLAQALRSGRLHHAYLFSGPRGCGKTSSARILARSLNCEQGPTPDPCGTCDSCRALGPDGPGSIDVIEIDAASHGGVDDARELRERAVFAPVSSRFKVYVIDEAHMVSSAGFNALLKLVEEPPDYVKFVFATTEPEKVLGTIKSRTHHYPFRLIPPGVLRPFLEQLCVREGVHVDPAVFPLVVRAGAGSVRDSLSVLDQLMAGAGTEGVGYSRAVALLGVTDSALIDEACDALAAGDGASVYATIDRVAEAGHDPRRFASDLLERLRDLIVLLQVPDAVAKGLLDCPDDQLERMTTQAAHLGMATLSRFADIVHSGLTEMRGTTAPRLLLELICARMLLPGADDSAAALLQRLERLERRLELGGPPAASVAHAPAPVTSSPAPATGSPAPGVPAVGASPAPGASPTSAAVSGAATAAGPQRAAGSRPAQPARAQSRPAVAPDSGPATTGRAGDGPEARAPETRAPEARAPETGVPSAGAPTVGAPSAGPPSAGASSAGAPSSASAGAPVPGGLDAAAVRRVWDEILTIVGRRSKRAAALVREATVRDVQGGTLILLFKHSFHADSLSKSPDLLVEALYELLGGRWQIRCEIAGADAAAQDTRGQRARPARAAAGGGDASGGGDGGRAAGHANAGGPARSADLGRPAGSAGPGGSAGSVDPGRPAGSAGPGRPAGSAGPGGSAGAVAGPRPSSPRPSSPRETAEQQPAGDEDWPATAIPGGGPAVTSGGAPTTAVSGGAPATAGGAAPSSAAGGAGPVTAAGGAGPVTAAASGVTVPAAPARAADREATSEPGAMSPMEAARAAARSASARSAPERSASARSAAERQARPDGQAADGRRPTGPGSDNHGGAGQPGGRRPGGPATVRQAAGSGAGRPAMGRAGSGRADTRGDAERPVWEGAADEPPFDPDYDGPRYPGFDPGDEPLDDDDPTPQPSSEELALRLLAETLGAERIDGQS